MTIRIAPFLVAFAWGLVAMIGAVLVSGLLAVTGTSEIRTGSEVTPPMAGRVHSREELDRVERLAEQELEEARRDVSRDAFKDELRNGWTRNLPWGVLAALVVILLATRRGGAGKVAIAAMPTLVLLLAVHGGALFSAAGLS
ncbi:hypothetical protein ACQ86G_11670 [Roseateles chitinivorans]|uniref:hypothetical protein n=1 Tax=Roseateles chitinivorans TaxID=2917965 RepID=UPI003D67BFC2